MNVCIKEKQFNTVIGQHKCTNCMACYNICPSGAIEIIEDKDGFAYPSIIKEKCIHCGLCAKKCPALNLSRTKEITERFETPDAYGGYSKDENTRKISTSGGVFSILSKYVFERGGSICGARFVKGGTVEHVIVNNWDDLAPLRGSKYVQSNINNCYKEIKILLEQDKYVLFTGTPCQVAGLYAVLNKDYEKLITVDLICHGTPSQKIFREYLNEITNGKISEVTSVQFRAKTEHWRKPYVCIEGNDFSIAHPASEDTYFCGFCNNLILRKSCTDCRFSKIPRQGDITIGDFWGVEEFDKELDDNQGTSIVLVNSPKGKEIFEKLKPEFKIIKETTIEAARKYNIINRKSIIHHNATYFRKEYAKGTHSSLCELIKNSLDKKNGIAIMNYAFSKINYGSVLAGYALQQKIKKYGYTPLNICFHDNEAAYDIGNLEDFQRRYIDFTPPEWSLEQLKKSNNYFQTYIVGPDVMWLDFNDILDFRNYKFPFVNFSKNICSYAASFGYSKLLRLGKNGEGWRPYTSQELQEEKRLLKRFSHISVREDTGVDICKNNFDVQATHVLDSVFLLSKDDWLSLVPKNARNEKFGAVSYIMHTEKQPKDVSEYIKNIENIKELYKGDTYGLFLSNQKKYKAYGPTVEDWLNSIANCDMLYTDSFHGMCFAIIFNKQFITFCNSNNGYNRHVSLYKMLGIPDRTARSIEDIQRLQNNHIDYEKVNSKLKEKIRLSEDFLEKILYSHEHPDPVRCYMESLELLVEEKVKQKNLTKVVNMYTHPSSPNKQKWYFLGIHVFKISMRKGEKWFYLFGIPLIKEVKKEHNTYYKLFGCIRLLKKAVRN